MIVSTRTKNPYLLESYEPVVAESSFGDLTVIGEIPKEMNGVFCRNGPNPQFSPKGRYHWFDGDAMVHALYLENQKAEYKNRYVETEDFLTEREQGEAVFSGILDPFDFTNKNPDKNTANTDLVYFNGELLATWWLAGTPYALNLDTLETKGSKQFSGDFSGMCAHPKLDPKTNEMMFINYDVYNAPYLQYGVIDGSGQVSNLSTIDVPGARIFHDIGITPNYTVLPDMPLTWNAERLKKGKRAADFRKDIAGRLGVLPRHGSDADIRWFETSPCYIFHIINCYEEGEEIVLIACRLEEPIATTRHNKEGKIPRLQFLQLNPFLHEWRMNLTTGVVEERQLDDVATEFPRMNNEKMGIKNRFSYNPRIAEHHSLLFDGVIKYDLESNTSIHFEYDEHNFGGEVVFVSDPGSKDEDGGWLTTFVYDNTDHSSYFIIIDARSMKEVARVLIPVRVPTGFHAWYVDKNE